MQPPVDADGRRRWLIFCMVSWYHKIGDKEEVQAMELHETLTRLRTEQGISQMELGAELGMSRQAISKWESGASVPTVENLVAISQWYGVTVDALLEGTAESTRESTAESKQERDSSAAEGESLPLKTEAVTENKNRKRIRLGIPIALILIFLMLGWVRNSMAAFGAWALWTGIISVCAHGISSICRWCKNKKR